MLNPSVDIYDMGKIRVKFNGRCLKQDIPTLLHGVIVNVYIVYQITNNFNVNSYPTLENCLFSAVKLTKHVDIDLYKYSGYGIGFDRKEFFFTSFWKNWEKCNNFVVDMSSSTKINNRKKYILIIGKGPTQGLEYTLSAEKCIQKILQKKTKFLFEFALQWSRQLFIC